MRRKSTSIGVAALALLLASAVPGGRGAVHGLYTLDASCTSVVWGPVPFHVVDQTKRSARNSMKLFIEDRDCIRNTVEYTITPQA